MTLAWDVVPESYYPPVVISTTGHQWTYYILYTFEKYMRVAVQPQAEHRPEGSTEVLATSRNRKFQSACGTEIGDLPEKCSS